jgi:hypothetical protein
VHTPAFFMRTDRRFLNRLRIVDACPRHPAREPREAGHRAYEVIVQLR